MDRKGFIVFIGFATTSLLATQADAQAIQSQESPVARHKTDNQVDILVTAQKRIERLADIPLALSVVAADRLARQGIVRPDDLETLVPGFTYRSTQYGTPVYAIRGIGFYDTSIGATPAVSIYLDQIPLAYSVEARGIVLDLEQLEILKGPQGTYYGQGTTGGALNFVAAKPGDVFSAGANLDLGRFDAVAAEGFASGPISPGLTMRISGRVERQDGWQRPWLPNDARFGQKRDARMGRRRFATARLLVDWTASDRLTFTFGANGWRDRSALPAEHFVGFAPVQPGNPYDLSAYAALSSLTEPPHDPRIAGWDAGRDFVQHDDFAQASVRANWAVGDTVEMTSISAVSHYRTKGAADDDGSAYADYVNLRTGRITSFSQEVRLSGEMQAMHWLLGTAYAHDRTEEAQTNLLAGGTSNSLGPFPVDAIDERNKQVATSYAAFSGIDLSLRQGMSVHGSLRYTRQDRTFRGCTADSGDGQFATAIALVFSVAARPGGCVTQATPGNLPPIISGSLNQDNLSFRASLDWKPRDDVLTYVALARGYKPGSFAIVPAVFAFQLDPVTQEKVLAYEAGARWLPAGHRLQLSSSIFYYDYADKQLFGTAIVLPFGALPKLINIPKSHVAGAEIEANLRPSTALDLSLDVSYVASRVDRDPLHPLDAFGSPTSLVGERFPNTPRWQLAGDVEYRHPVGAMTGFVGGHVTARSATFGAFGDNGTLRIAGYALLDLRLGIEALDGCWRAELWGRNVTNHFYYTSLGHNADVVAGLTGMPATYGIRIERHFGGHHG